MPHRTLIFVVLWAAVSLALVGCGSNEAAPTGSDSMEGVLQSDKAGAPKNDPPRQSYDGVAPTGEEPGSVRGR